jgi:hypothetical protein
MPSTPDTFKVAEDGKAMQIDTTDLAKTVQIKADLRPKSEGELVDFLQCNKEVFVWRLTEILGVSWEVLEHILNIKPESKPIKQGMHRFNQEKREAIGVELARLLAAGFIK